ATENLMEIIEQDDEGTKEATSHSKKHFRGDIAFKNIAFSYETRSDVPVLKDISFNINSGEQLAIVGPSGAGKSTITALLLRFYNPISGQILIDGKDAASYDLTEYRSQFALVPQEVLLFNGTIKENIAYGRPGASDEE